MVVTDINNEELIEKTAKKLSTTKVAAKELMVKAFNLDEAFNNLREVYSTNLVKETEAFLAVQKSGNIFKKITSNLSSSAHTLWKVYVYAFDQYNEFKELISIHNVHNPHKDRGDGIFMDLMELRKEFDLLDYKASDTGDARELFHNVQMHYGTIPNDIIEFTGKLNKTSSVGRAMHLLKKLW